MILTNGTLQPEYFYTQSLHSATIGAKVVSILSAAVKAVDPYEAIKNFLGVHNSELHFGSLSYPALDFERIMVLAFGKASIPMILAAKETLAENFTCGMAITKFKPDSSATAHPDLSIFQGSHPVPDERCIHGTEQIIHLLATTSTKDLVIFLISGGGSSLLTSPAEGITLENIQNITELLLRCGATINEMNCVRKHLSRVKGGSLARLAAPAQVVTLVLSDVIGDPLEVIASGPTVPDPTTFAEAQAILMKYQLTSSAPETILERFRKGIRGQIPETPKANDPIFNKVENFIIGNNNQAAQAAKSKARLEGFNTILLSTGIQGEARLIGQWMASIAAQITKTGDPLSRPACIIAGGETTVTLVGNGLGGRNQEAALAAVKSLSGLLNVIVVTLATDGEDGPTDAAGAVVAGETLQRARALGLDPDDFLSRNDSYPFFNSLGDLLKPGSTGTNVGDLQFIFAF